MANVIEPITSVPGRDRRSFLRSAAVAVGGGAVALAATACTTGSNGTATASGGTATTQESLLDKWTRNKTAKIGMFLPGDTTGFKNPTTGKPDGFRAEITNMLFADIGNITLDITVLPVAQLVDGLVAGQFDMIGQGLAILPSRALKGLFADFPVYYEGNIVWLKPGSTVQKLSDLNKSGVRIAVVSGGTQQFAAPVLLPNATVAPFAQQPDAIAEAGTGRAEAVLIASQSLAGYVAQYPKMRILDGPPLFVDANTFLMPFGDYKLQSFITNWLRYQACHGVQPALWLKWLGPNLKKAGVTVQLSAPGTGGEAVAVSY